MSSPPYRATSPPNLASLNVPRKRPSVNTSIPNSIRHHRAPSSVASSSAHPLRQTSFPPPEQAVVSRASSFSPTVDGSVTGRSSTAATGKRKRGRPKASEARSKAGSGAGRDNAGNEGGDGAKEDEEAEDDEAEGGVDTVLEDAGTADEAQLKVERENMRMLIEAFSRDQGERYERWRRVRLDKATVRKLVNQTLSQSVPPSVITSVNGYTKLFIGELIERARDVQNEWLIASPTLPTGEPKPHLRSRAAENGTMGTSSQSASSGRLNGLKAEPDSSAEYLGSDDTEEATQETNDIKYDLPSRFAVEERDRGPLTPDHLREALRRYKKDREGGSAGFHGLSLQGRTNVASRVGGKRLFL